MKKFISVEDVENIQQLIEQGMKAKANPHHKSSLGKYKTLGLIFFNASLRTRMSTQKAAQNLGLNVICMNFSQEGWQLEFEDGAIMKHECQEHIKDAASVLSQYCDIIGVRSFAKLSDQKEDYSEVVLNAFVKNSNVPVISLESATLHPLQSLADLITIQEHAKHSNPKIVLSWAPHPKALPQAVANSFAEWVIKAGYDLTISHPMGMELAPQFTTGAKIEYDQLKALEDADFVYAKNWSSFSNYGSTREDASNWIIDEDKMKLTNNAHFMHCLPIRRNVIATDKVLDNKKSLIIEQANNRTYAAQAVLEKILENE